MSKLSRSAILVSTLTICSRLLGFLRIAVVAFFLGAQGMADVVNLLFSIPNNLRKLLSEGAFSAAFIPAIHRSDAQKKDTVGFVRAIITLQMLGVGVITLCAILFARPIVYGLFSFPDATLMSAAVSLFHYLFPYILWTVLSAVFMGALHTRDHFLAPALSPILFSCAVILSILLLYARIGVYSFAVGVLLGGGLQCFVQFPSFLKAGFSVLPTRKIPWTDIKVLFRDWGPLLLISLLTLIGQQVAVSIASSLPSGNGSALTNALVFWQLPLGVFSTAIITVFYPRITKYITYASWQEAGEVLQWAVNKICYLLIPSSIFFCIFSQELIAVSLQRGAFGLDDTIRTAQVLQYLGVGLVFTALFSLFQRLGYALKKFFLVFLVMGTTTIVDIVLSILFSRGSLEAAGLALALSLSNALGMLFLWCFLLPPVLRKYSLTVLRCSFIAVCCTLPGVISALMVRSYMGAWWMEGSSVISIIKMLVLTIVYTGVILICYRLAKIKLFS